MDPDSLTGCLVSITLAFFLNSHCYNLLSNDSSKPSILLWTCPHW